MKEMERVSVGKAQVAFKLLSVWLVCVVICSVLLFADFLLMRGFTDCDLVDSFVDPCATGIRMFVHDALFYSSFASFILSFILPVMVYRRRKPVELAHVINA